MGGAKLGKATLSGVKDVVTAPFRTFKQDTERSGGLLMSLAAGFQGVGKFTNSDMINGLKKDAEDAGKYDDLYDIDVKLILKATKQSINNVLIYKLIDYQGKYYKGKNLPTKAEQERFKAFTEGNRMLTTQDASANKTPQQNQDQTSGQQQANTQQATEQNNNSQTVVQDTQNINQKNESFKESIHRMLLEAGDPIETGQQNPQVQQPTPAQNQSQNQQANNSATTEQQKEAQKAEQKLTKYQEISKLYEVNRKNFYVYYVQTANNIKNKAQLLDQEVTSLNDSKNFLGIVDSFFSYIGTKQLSFSPERGNPEINTRFIQNVKYLTSGRNSSTVTNRFAICFGSVKDRKIFISGGEIENQEESIDDLYDSFNKKEKEILRDYQLNSDLWKDNLYLKHQELNLEKQNNLKLLFDALRKRKEEVKGQLKESTEENTIDLHINLIEKEGLTKSEEYSELSHAETIVSDFLTMIKNYKLLGMSDDNWKRMIKFTYIPGQNTKETKEETKDTKEEKSDNKSESPKSEQKQEPDKEKQEEKNFNKNSITDISKEYNSKKETPTPKEVDNKKETSEVKKETSDSKKESNVNKTNKSPEEIKQDIRNRIAALRKGFQTQSSSNTKQENSPKPKKEKETPKKPTPEEKAEMDAKWKENKKIIQNIVNDNIKKLRDEEQGKTKRDEQEEELVESADFLKQYFSEINIEFDGLISKH